MTETNELDWGHVSKSLIISIVQGLTGKQPHYYLGLVSLNTYVH